MTREEIRTDVAITVTDLSAKVRESILAGNASAAADWAGALRDAASAYEDLRRGDDD